MEEILDSILNTIKKLVGLDKDYGPFDVDLIVAINSALAILFQLGAGPENPYYITGPENTWAEFFGDKQRIEMAKSYIYLRTRLLFDPPTSGVLHEAMERQITEYEWRIAVQVEWNAQTDPVNPAGTGDHSVLINRDLSDQHPTSAITGLDEKLGTIPRPMTRLELLAILTETEGGK